MTKRASIEGLKINKKRLIELNVLDMKTFCRSRVLTVQGSGELFTEKQIIKWAMLK